MRSAWQIAGLVCVSGLLVGCGGEEPADERPQAGAPILGGERTPPPPDSTTPTPVESQPVAEQIPLRDGTAEEAVATYVNRYRAGDFEGALEVCDMESEGAQALDGTIKGYENARASGVNIDLTSFLTDGLEGVTWERVDETATDEFVEFRLMFDGEETKKCAAVLKDGVWRVQPHESGSP